MLFTFEPSHCDIIAGSVPVLLNSNTQRRFRISPSVRTTYVVRRRRSMRGQWSEHCGQQSEPDTCHSEPAMTSRMTSHHGHVTLQLRAILRDFIANISGTPRGAALAGNIRPCEGNIRPLSRLLYGHEAPGEINIQCETNGRTDGRTDGSTQAASRW